MNKRLRFIFFLLAFLILPSLCQASVTILTDTDPDYTVTSGSDEKVYGTSAANQITLESGAKAELVNFPGSNSIIFESDVTLFTVSRSGTVLLFQGSEGTSLKIPATSAIQTISFTGGTPLVLTIHNNRVMLDDQVITVNGHKEVSHFRSLKLSHTHSFYKFDLSL